MPAFFLSFLPQLLNPKNWLYIGILLVVAVCGYEAYSFVGRYEALIVNNQNLTTDLAASKQAYDAMVQQAAVQHQTDTDTLNNALAEQKRLSDLSQQAAGDLLAIQSSGTTPQPDSTATTPNTSGGSPAATQPAGIPTDVDHSCISSPPIRTILSRLRSRVPTTAAR